MTSTNQLRFFKPTLLVCYFFVWTFTVDAQVQVKYTNELALGARVIENAIQELGMEITDDPADAEQLIDLAITRDGSIGEEGYEIGVIDQSIYLRGGNLAGTLYGAYDLAEELLMQGDLSTISSQKHDPTFAVRAIKFNLPWSAYRESKSMDYHLETCRDLRFWESFLNMMLENRFNTLLLYNKHPFPYMVQLEEYPEASPFSATEMEDWQQFWKSLFAMAKARGVEVFVVNWNIVVSEGFAEKQGVPVYNDTSQITIDYTRKSVTKLIDTYEDLAGVGVTLADWMRGQNPAEREDWIQATFLEGMRQAKRKVKFLHRAVLSGSSDEMRRILQDTVFLEPVLTEVKFNWSHGHSTPELFITHASESGAINTGFWEPKPENYKIQWMVRNEDFFILRWGDSDFIRAHIRENTRPFMNGYHIGSEGYIPAFEYFTKEEVGRTWEYAFERQWLFYKMWGRLLYDADTPDEVFVLEFDRRYGAGKGEMLLQAYELVSKMPLRLASYFKSTWDYTLYSEGFLSAMHQDRYGKSDGHSPFISIDELIEHQVLDKRYLSIKDYVDLLVNKLPVPEGKITPFQLAEELLGNGDVALGLVRRLGSSAGLATVAYQQELDDIRIWAHLSRYFGNKLRAGVHLELFRRNGTTSNQEIAVNLLEVCLEDWTTLAQIGQENYKTVPYWDGTVFGFDDEQINFFSWHNYTTDVIRDHQMAKEEQR